VVVVTDDILSIFDPHYFAGNVSTSMAPSSGIPDETIRENLAWLDKYLGPVERAAQ
jgi:hypothetical protein